MSYISSIINGDKVYVWERVGGERITKVYDAPYFFFVKDKNGKHESIFGERLTKLTFKDRKDATATKRDFIDHGHHLYESDIPADIRILSEHYYKAPAPDLNITFLDIEVDYDKNIGFSTIDNPYAPINAIAFYHRWNKKYVVIAVPPEEGWTEQRLKEGWENNDKIPNTSDNLEIILCKNEKELLLNILIEIQDSDLLAGWNSFFFDMPYIGKRIERVLGQTYFKKLSFPNSRKPKYREVEMFGNTNTTLDIYGRLSCDYLELFKKYEMDKRPSYKLESIAEAIVPDLPKLAYEGTLADLYRNDFVMFIRYNIRDTEILEGFEQKLGYVGLANEMYHISGGNFTHVGGTLKLAELAINNYCIHELNLRVPDNRPGKKSGHIQGACVLQPQQGMHDWIGSIDINSLYPSAIRSINISPETLIGQFDENEKAVLEIEKESLVMLHLELENGEVIEMDGADFREYLLAKKWAISGYGTVFDQHKEGIIPAILRNWYNTRKQYQKKKAEAFAAGDTQKSAYFDRLQYVYKIKLNSLYGALNNQHFRFYDLRMGESTTGTGRMILLHQCAYAAKVLDGEYMMPDIDTDTAKGYTEKHSIIYGDTDSVYFETHATNEDEAVLIADAVAEQVTNSFQEYMSRMFLCSEGYDNIIQAGREIVASKGIFVDKKRYILRVVDNEGDKKVKLKIMGLDTKKTTLPKHVSNVLNAFVGRLLEGEQWESLATEIVEYKDELWNTKDISMIGLPKGVQKVEKYTQELHLHGATVRLPGHIAASIFYNACLEKYEDKVSMPIVSGMKIKIFYLKEKVGRFKAIAIPTDIERMPQWFLDNYPVDKDAHIERLVDNPLNNIIRAIGQVTPTRQSILQGDLLGF